MIFSGSVQAMITSLKNNARKRISGFKLLKEKGDIFNNHKTILKFKELPKEELEKVKEKIRNDVRKKTKKRIIINLIIITPILVFSIIFFKNMIEESNKISLKERNLELEKRKKIEEKYLNTLNIGYNWLYQENYSSAKYYFIKAKTNKPDDYRGIIALTTAYVYDCVKNNKDRMLAEKHLKELEKKYGDKAEVKELRNYYEKSKK